MTVTGATFPGRGVWAGALLGRGAQSRAIAPETGSDAAADPHAPPDRPELSTGCAFSAGFACHFRRFRGGSGFIPYPVRPVNAVRVRDTVKVEESFCGPPWLSIMIGSVLTGPGASIQPTISGV